VSRAVTRGGTLVLKYHKIHKILRREREAHTHTHERSVFEALSLFLFSKIVRVFVCLFDAIG